MLAYCNRFQIDSGSMYSNILRFMTCFIMGILYRFLFKLDNLSALFTSYIQQYCGHKINIFQDFFIYTNLSVYTLGPYTITIML